MSLLARIVQDIQFYIKSCFNLSLLYVYIFNILQIFCWTGTMLINNKNKICMGNKSCFLISQLDDWVLCRVQQKGNTSKNKCNSQGSSPEYWSGLQKVEQTQYTYANPNIEMITDFLYKDCTLLASILAGQAPPISSVSFQRTNNGYEAGPNYKVNSTISISSPGFISETLKRKSTEEITKKNPFRIDNNLASKSNNVDLLPRKRMEENYISSYNHSHSQNDIVKANPIDTTDYEELNEMAILGRYFSEI